MHTVRWCAGVILPLLSQSVMFWNLTFSKFVLKKQLQWQQLAGAAAVVLGVCIGAFPADGGPGLLAGVRSHRCELCSCTAQKQRN